MQDMIKIGFPTVTMESREANILNCLQKNESADAFIDDVLQHRKLK